MLVRFNKGPWHRKVQQVDDRQGQGGVINVAVHDDKFDTTRLYDSAPGLQAVVYPHIKIATYRLKMVYVNVRGTVEPLPSIYPDGAVCFEYEGAM